MDRKFSRRTMPVVLRRSDNHTGLGSVTDANFFFLETHLSSRSQPLSELESTH